MGAAKIEIMFDDGSSRFAVLRNMFAQVRRGRLTVEALDLMAATWRSLVRKVPGPLYGLFVLEADADMPPVEVRTRQKELFAEIATSKRLRGALVVEGSGVYVQLRRVILRTMSETQMFYDVEEAARHLASSSDERPPSVADLVAVAAAARFPPPDRERR